MKGRVCLVTGGNGGVGFETARGLARHGATVILLCRSKERGAEARQAIADETKAEVSLVVADLASLSDVRRAAQEVAAAHPRLHVLVNNAAVFLGKREVTADGYEKTFATNYLGHFLLTELLLERLKAGAPARIINVSTLPRGISIDIDDLQLEKRSFSTMKAVGGSRMAQLLFTRGLARRLEGTGVTVNTLHPGLVRSGLLNDAYPAVVRAFFNLFSKSPAEGAQTPLYLATSPDVEKVTGALFADQKQQPWKGQTTDDALARRLYEVSLKLVGLDAARAAA